MKPRKRRFTTVKRTKCLLRGGPYDGLWARLDSMGGLRTLPFTARGQSGYYSLHEGKSGNVLGWNAS
jgi:hypothetical protein